MTPNPCECTSHAEAVAKGCRRAGRAMSIRDHELCSGACPAERPCPAPLSEQMRRHWDGLPPLKTASLPPALRSPCAHRGEEVRRQTCATCAGKVEIKVFGCKLHGTCTLAKHIDGAHLCATCTDYDGGWAFSGPVVRNLLYYIYPRKGNGAWQHNVAELLRRMRLFNGRRIVAIATDNTTDPVEAVKGMFWGQVHEFIEIPNQSIGETVVFTQLVERVITRDRHQVTFYAHAKGVTKPAVETAMSHLWADLMYETCLDYWPLVREKLEQQPLVGTFLRRFIPSADTDSRWLFAGNFFWFRNARVFEKPNWNEIKPVYGGAETWAGRHFHESEACALLQVTDGHALDMYSQALFHGTILPLMDAWRQENRQHRKLVLS